MNLFKINSKCAFIFIMSLVSGFPSNAKYTKELYDKKLINEYEASKILAFTHFSNPLFILGTLSILFLNNEEAGLLILICHYISNIIIGLIFRNYHPSTKETNNINLKSIFQNNKANNNIGKILTNSITSTILTLLNILGTITVFLVITTILNKNINLNNFYQSIINGFFEVTQGLKYISELNIPLKLKSTLSCMILSFGGLSVHMQIYSIICDTKIKYLPFLIGRLLHSTISSILVFIFFDLWISIT